MLLAKALLRTRNGLRLDIFSGGLSTSLLSTSLLSTSVLSLLSVLSPSVLPTSFLCTSFLCTSMLCASVLPTSVLPTSVLCTSACGAMLLVCLILVPFSSLGLSCSQVASTLLPLLSNLVLYLKGWSSIENAPQALVL